MSRFEPGCNVGSALALGLAITLGQNLARAQGVPMGERPEIDPAEVSAANSQRCTDIGVRNTFDDFITHTWNCEPRMIDDMNGRFGIENDWFGFGLGLPCDSASPLGSFQDTPLGRTYNALQLLLQAGQTQASCARGAGHGMLEWAYCYVGQNISLVPSCDFPRQAAITYYPFANETTLYGPFFFEMTVIQRAATLVHEARHADGKCQHVDDRDCRRHGSCDEAFQDGCTGLFSKGGRGANGYEVSYLQAFLREAGPDINRLPGDINDSLRVNAMETANDILGSAFEVDPCIRFDSDGNEIWSCFTDLSGCSGAICGTCVEYNTCG